MMMDVKHTFHVLIYGLKPGLGCVVRYTYCRRLICPLGNGGFQEENHVPETSLFSFRQQSPSFAKKSKPFLNERIRILGRSYERSSQVEVYVQYTQ